MEWLAAKLLLRRANVFYSGVGLKQTASTRSASCVITCGLAGALDPALAPGTVFVPDWVRRPDSEQIECDPQLVATFRTAAERLGYSTASGGMLTSDKIVTGSERVEWAKAGFVAADMETAKVKAERVASVRVILDNHEFSIAEDWERASSSIARPRLWGELAWLARNAPRYAFRAARVVRTGLELRSEM